MEGQEPRRGFRAVPLLCSSLAVLLGVMTFVGWISGLPLLASVRAKYIPMAPSTALCFSLLGAGLILQIVQPKLRWISRMIGALALTIACMKLAEFIGAFHFGIDAWFVRNPGMFGAVPTGRTAPMTALNFVFTAAGLFALTSHWRWTGAFGALATIISAVVIVGYWYGTPLLYGGTVIPVALSTGCAFFLCGVSCHFRETDFGRSAALQARQCDRYEFHSPPGSLAGCTGLIISLPHCDTNPYR